MENPRPAAPAPRPPSLKLDLLFTFSFAVLVAVPVLALGVVLPGPATPSVTNTVQGVGFGWESPSEPNCSASQLIWTEQPRVPFNVTSGEILNISYEMMCAPSSSATPSSYEVYAAVSACPGVAVIESNVPVQVVSTVPSWLNVTIRITNAATANGITIQLYTAGPPATAG